MGRGDEFGTLEAGKLADVLVVDGDVLGGHLAAGGPLAVPRRDAGGRDPVRRLRSGPRSRPAEVSDQPRSRLRRTAVGRPDQHSVDPIGVHVDDLEVEAEAIETLGNPRDVAELGHD